MAGPNYTRHRFGSPLDVLAIRCEWDDDGPAG